MSLSRTLAATPAQDAGVAHRPLRDRLAVPLALFALYVIWGSTYLAIRIAVRTIPPFLMGGARFLLGGAILFVFLRLRGGATPTPRQWCAAAVVGTLLLAGGNGLVGFSEQSVASGLAALLIATVPLWAALFAGVWGRWPTRLETLGLLLGISGVAVLNAGSGLHGHPLAAALLLLAACSWALGSVWSRHLPMPSGAMSSAAQMLAGGAVMIVLGLARGERLHTLPSASSTWALLYLLVFGSLVAFSAYTYLLQRVRPALATSYAYVNPAVAVLLGIVLEGEAVTPLEMVALLIILTAVALVILGRQRAARPA